MKLPYAVGAGPAEIDRLSFQGAVWRPMTESLLDQLGVGPGMRCLDFGAGIGLVSLPLSQRVLPGGSVTAVEAAPLYAETLREQIARKDFENIEVVETDLAGFKPKRGEYDLIFSRWTFSFLPDAEKTLKNLVPGLKKGGALAIEDYHHLECAYYPSRPSFDAIIGAARDWFDQRGGNYRVAGELPAIYHRLGLKEVEVIPHLRVGGPDSDLWKWADSFFQGRLPDLIQEGLIDTRLAETFKKDLAETTKVPGALFVVPTIFDVIGRRK
jgi:ubiquinone/menaquinone biosynthesis C-methylase UbiE